MTSPPPSGSLHPLPPERHWRLRYGLRTFLLTVCALSIVLGVIGNWWIGLQRQRRIVARIVAMGGDVHYGYEFGMGDELETVTTYSGSSSTSIELVDGLRKRTRVTASGEVIEIESPPGPKFIRRWLGNDAFSSVEAVQFFGWSRAEEDLPPEVDLVPHHLLALPRLRAIWLAQSQVNDEWLEQIAQTPRLEALALISDRSSKITVEGLAQLESARQLRSLGLGGEAFDDTTLQGIAKLEQLVSLDLSSVPNVSSDSLANLERLTALRQLCIIWAKRIDDRGTSVLSRLQNLETLWLAGTSVSDPTLNHIAGLNKLTWLALSNTNVGDEGIRHLAGLSRLECLQLAHSQVGDESLKTISRLPRITNLNLDKTNVTDNGMAAIASMTQLEVLNLCPAEIHDEGLLRLKTLKNLQRLRVGPHISNAAAKELSEALPKCEISWENDDGSHHWEPGMIINPFTP